MSKRVQILGSYLNENATASADTTATGYEAQATVFLERSTSWKATNTAAVRLIHNLGSAKTPSGLGLAGCNFASWGTTKLQHSTDGAAWTDFLTLTGFPADALDYFATLTAAPSRQYWCLYWAAPAAAPQVAIFYLGTLTELPVNPDIDMGGEDEFNVDEEPAASGAIQAEEFGRRIERWALGLTSLTTAQFTTIRDLLRTESGKRPFWYIPRDDVGSGVQGQAHLVRGPLRYPWSEEYTGVWTIPTLALREES